MYIGFQAAGVADTVLASDASLTVTLNDDGIEFRDRTNARHSGLIFLPGGAVEPLAYTPLLRQIATAGYPAQLLYLPMRCACTEAQRNHLFETIRQRIAAEPETRWILAGHSRGAMLASTFLHNNPTGLAALVLIGTTHPRDFSLSDSAVPITKIYGTRDGIASYSAIQQNKHLLPPQTRWIGIEGGNHVQFGYYRHQLGDDEATISRDQQQAQLVRALLDLLDQPSQPESLQ